jgi:hypothetical protein
MTFFEIIIEQASLDWFKDLGNTSLFGGDIAPKGPVADLARWSATGVDEERN